jgi:DNA-binding GntR family transcriptional regulator
VTSRPDVVAVPAWLLAAGPAWLRIAVRLHHEIADGEYAAERPLPSEAALAQRFSVSVPTVRQALGALQQAGEITVRHGVGRFVAADAATSQPVREEAITDDAL